ncbi:uncharacterized protein N0V89_010854 [Didymosphaeria variabile]|uniref:Uncharacterized protein n=1 Tax=Didymosphaeria variabile TaxID=1932322 RepID=A0A9W8XE51_9PLEO|nr:uncharacterized protein N0V89_010854 [Didymosphaeria variabile]KAJ4346921.1 hypothetical protein N0V89_010854 [Didymosphaeria variabile]
MDPATVTIAPMAFQPLYYTQPSFFEHLNYDVRQIIYQFMENHLPPVSHSLHYAGFALSCKQAYTEIRQPAMKGLRRFLEDFQRNLERYTSTSLKIIPNVSLDSPFTSVRHITLRIPPSLVTSSFDTQLDKAVVALRPILSGRFQKATLLFVDPHNEYPANFKTAMRVSSGFALFRLSQIIMDERKVQSSITALSKYVSKLPGYDAVHPNTTAQPYSADFTGTLLYEGHDLPHPISTTNIQIAWDWRPEELISTPSTLRGYLHEYSAQAEKHQEPTWPQLYVVGSDDKSVGMQGVVCKQRWNVSESVRVYWLLQEHRYKSLRGYCWSEGVGKDVQQGLGGMSAKEFQERNPPLVLAALF